MRRRQFIAGLGSAAAWPLTARAQQGERVRVIGVMVAGGVENDSQIQKRLAAFHDTLGRLGWQEGGNLRTEIRYGTGQSERMRAGIAELVAKSPDVIVVGNTPAAKTARQLNPTIPIVFTAINDPVASGLVGNLAHPENNTTGFANFEASIGGKWVELLKEAAPRVTRIAEIFDPANVPDAYHRWIDNAASKLGMRVTRVPVRDAIDIVRAIDEFASEQDGGLLLLADATIALHREAIFRLALQHRLPAIYGARYSANEGGMIGYGIEYTELYRGAANYVDRILRGEMVSELPVQFPAKFELAVNLKTARAIGLTIPESFLLRADEVIE